MQTKKNLQKTLLKINIPTPWLPKNFSQSNVDLELYFLFLNNTKAVFILLHLPPLLLTDKFPEVK